MVKGLGSFRAKLRRVPAAVQAEVEKALERIADQVVADMKRLAPRDTGALRNSIGWTWGDAPSGSLAVGHVGGDADGLRITIYAGTRDKTLGDADAFYARFQEFGTVDMPANPFFWPAWRAHRKKVRPAIGRAVRRALKNA